MHELGINQNPLPSMHKSASHAIHKLWVFSIVPGFYFFLCLFRIVFELFLQISASRVSWLEMTHNAWIKSLSYSTIFHSRNNNKMLNRCISAPLISTRSSFFASRLYRITDILLLLSAASFIFAPFAPRMSAPQDKQCIIYDNNNNYY